jgi:allantoinase
VDEFEYLPADLLEPALAEIARIDSVLIVHAEDPSHLHEAHGRSYDDFVASRPPASETEAIAHVIDAMRATGARAHILHVSAADSLDLIRAARAEGLPLTVETCPHYLTLRAEDVPAGGTQFKCCPPIRDGANQDLLWDAVLDGTFDAIVSDHSPATVDVKSVGDGDFGLSWGGIAGLQLGFSVVWTEARRRGLPLDAILPLFTTGPARVASLGAGVIEAGVPAHLVAFAPDEERVVDVRTLEHKNPVSPYDGATVAGVARTVWLRGEAIVDHGAISLPGTGHPVLPEPARA